MCSVPGKDFPGTRIAILASARLMCLDESMSMAADKDVKLRRQQRVWHATARRQRRLIMFRCMPPRRHSGDAGARVQGEGHGVGGVLRQAQVQQPVACGGVLSAGRAPRRARCILWGAAPGALPCPGFGVQWRPLNEAATIGRDPFLGFGGCCDAAPSPQDALGLCWGHGNLRGPWSLPSGPLHTNVGRV